jgi:transposase
MSGKRYTEEFKIAAVKQVAQRGHPVSEVAERLGVSIHSLYTWVKRYGVPDDERKAVDAQSDEMRRLKAELKRVTEERDILKKAAAGSTGQGNTWASLSPGVMYASVFLGRVFSFRAIPFRSFWL